MRYVLDSSAIINLIQRLEERSIDILKESITADLAFYEIGNYLWKINRGDLVEDFVKVLKFIKAEYVGLREEVLAIAVDERLTYYDSVYLYLSRKYGLPLISDDRDLVGRGARRSSEV